jgi:hypothetical protein
MPLLWQNVRHGARIFLCSPGFPAVTAFSLALGIGATTAIFSILDAVLFRELPVPHPRNGGRVPFSYPMFQALDRGQQVFSGFYGWTHAALSNVESSSGSVCFVGVANLGRPTKPK